MKFCMSSATPVDRQNQGSFSRPSGGLPREGLMAANCELLTEFLEVAIHVILCERRVYPEAIFTSQRAFGVPVKMSRHPEVNDYISTALRDARPLLDADAVENVVLLDAVLACCLCQHYCTKKLRVVERVRLPQLPRSSALSC